MYAAFEQDNERQLCVCVSVWVCGGLLLYIFICECEVETVI